MAQTIKAFTQPAQQGGLVDIEVTGDTVINLDDLIYLFGYGYYKIRGIISGNNHSGGGSYKYRAELHIRTGGSAASIVPAGTIINTFTESVQHRLLTYSLVIALSFLEEDYRTLNLTGDISFSAQHHNPAKAVVVRIRNTSGVTSRNLAFPASWIFIGPAGRPSTIAPSRTGILSITCFGTSDADIIAAWAVQA